MTTNLHDALQKPVATAEGFVPFVFVNVRRKKPLRRWSVTHAFQAAAERAKVDGVSFHTTRHTAVSRMVAAGIPDRVITKVVGHTTANMVSRYAHLAPESVKGSTDCLTMGSYTDRTNPCPEKSVSVNSWASTRAEIAQR